jgi:hypothetical protein
LECGEEFISERVIFETGSSIKAMNLHSSTSPFADIARPTRLLRGIRMFRIIKSRVAVVFRRGVCVIAT